VLATISSLIALIVAMPQNFLAAYRRFLGSGFVYSDRPSKKLQLARGARFL